MQRTLTVCLLAVCFALAGLSQTLGTLRGLVADETGAVVPGAKVSATGPGGEARVTTSANDGTYGFTQLAPGSWSVIATSPGLTQFQPVAATIAGSAAVTVNLQLRVSLEKQEVTVQAETTNTVSTDPSNNAGSITLKQEDLQSLSDDPDDLANDLQALAGPSAGPNGGQIYIDGFTGGRLPPKESIREIRINQNPFSSEYDKLGFGRIEILTKPGTDKLRGQAFFSISDQAFNARNPFLQTTAPFQSRQFGGNVSGAINKKSSFFLDFDRREIDDTSIIAAQILDPSLNFVPYSNFVLSPLRRTTFSPRIDYQLSTNNTLTARYTWALNDHTNAGLNEFTLPSQAYSTSNHEQTVQVTETAILNTRTVNETRFQYIRERNNQNGNNLPVVNVLQAFSTGGSLVGLSYSDQDRWELQNYTSYAKGTHAIKFGVRLRGVLLTDVSRSNFGGTFSFAGGTGPQLDPATNLPILDSSGQPILQRISSLEVYRRTLLFQQQGLSATQIRALGGGASQFTQNAGNPGASVGQVDAGIFVQDDWRVRPNLTLSLGLRYEIQSNLSDYKNFAPRIGFAWAPGSSKASLRPKTVVRGGFGIFYDRFGESYTLDAERFNGQTQQQYRVINPDFYLNNIPAVSTLSAQRQNQAIREIDNSLRAPYILQEAIGVERQLPRNTSLAVTFTNSRADHVLRTRDINQPLPGTYDPKVPGSGVRPYGNVGEINIFESTGLFTQKQLLVNINTRFNKNFSMFGGYVLSYSNSNVDSPTALPANSYDLSTEFGRSSIDSRHRLFLAGSANTWWNVRLSPFIIARSSTPFNITTGSDLYGDSAFTARPAFASDPTAPGVIVNQFGAFDPNPKPGQTIVPRNYGVGPAFFSVNLRLSKTFGFGGEKASAARPGAAGGMQAGGPPMGGMRGGPGGGGGGERHGGGGGGGGFGGGDTTSKRYNLIFSVQARNLFNHTNEGQYIGNLTSNLFGTTNTLASGFGGRSSSSNRLIELQLRFSF